MENEEDAEGETETEDEGLKKHGEHNNSAIDKGKAEEISRDGGTGAGMDVDRPLTRGTV